MLTYARQSGHAHNAKNDKLSVKFALDNSHLDYQKAAQFGLKVHRVLVILKRKSRTISSSNFNPKLNHAIIIRFAKESFRNKKQGDKCKVHHKYKRFRLASNRLNERLERFTLAFAYNLSTFNEDSLDF